MSEIILNQERIPFLENIIDNAHQTKANKTFCPGKLNTTNQRPVKTVHMGAQWLSGRVLDSRPKGRGFEPHRRHCVVVLEQDTFILA